MKKEDMIDHDLKVMETVEKELDRQRHETAFSLILFLSATNLWILLVALWEKLGRPLTREQMTLLVEAVATVVLLVILKCTRLSVKQFGLGFKNMKKTLIRAGIISAVSFAGLVGAKLILHPGEPLFSGPFTTFYFITAPLQEFIARGFFLTTLIKLTPSDKSKMAALVCSSLLFSSLHLYYGFNMMLIAGGLSFVLGLIYLKDENIWGVSIIHYVIGLFAFWLKVV